MARWPRPARQREVRRLLAEARHTDPMPAEVADRLDRVLADLGAQQAERVPGTSVTDLATRRRRRATKLLVAAAAVVAVGVGVDQLLVGTSSSGGGASSGSAAASSDAGGARSDANGDRASSQAGREGAAGGSRSGRLTLSPVLRVRPDHFSDDAARARRVAVVALNGLRAADGAVQDYSAASPHARSTFVCQRVGWGPGALVPVRYEHAPAVLVMRPPRGDTQVVDLFRCGSPDPLRSTTLSVR